MYDGRELPPVGPARGRATAATAGSDVWLRMGEIIASKGTNKFIYRSSCNTIVTKLGGVDSLQA